MPNEYTVVWRRLRASPPVLLVHAARERAADADEVEAAGEPRPAQISSPRPAGGPMDPRREFVLPSAGVGQPWQIVAARPLYEC